MCCIGSPRSCPAAELMLASMFKVKPFRKPTSSLPFHFIWSPKTLKFHTSAFALDAEDIEAENHKLAKEILEEKAWALKVADILYEVHRVGRKEWSVYGVVAAQRRAGGRVWVVVAGLSGPATYASALAVASQKTGSLPEIPEHGGRSEVLWALVEATVRQGPETYGDNREVVGVEVLETRTFHQ